MLAARKSQTVVNNRNHKELVCIQSVLDLLQRIFLHIFNQQNINDSNDVRSQTS